MAGNIFPAHCFEENRAHLRQIAHRVLGSKIDAEDAIQEAWLRVEQTDFSKIKDVRGWLTTVVARICLDMLRGRRIRRETPIRAETEQIASAENIERELLRSDAIGAAMLVVLGRLSPTERVTIVLHDLFEISLKDIAYVIGRSQFATRQIASRARRRLQDAHKSEKADLVRKRKLVEAFRMASREGDFAALLAILDPEVTLRVDSTAIRESRARAYAGAPILTAEIIGSKAVVKAFEKRAQGAQLALINGDLGLTYCPFGTPLAVIKFAVEKERIVTIAMIADKSDLAAMQIAMLQDESKKPSATQ